MSLTKKYSIHGREAFTTTDGELAGRNGVSSGGEGAPSVVYPSNDFVSIFDDFLGDLVGDEWAFVEGDTGFSGTLVTATNGIFRITSSETQGVAPTDNAALTQGLFKNWKANQGAPGLGRLRLAARIKGNPLSTTAESGRNHLFVGFSDSGGAEMPAYDTGAGVISNAADLAGFIWSPSGQSTAWKAVAAKSTAGDSGDQAVATSVTPTSNVYTTLEVELRSGAGDTGGTAHFFIDGVPVASIDSPVGSATAMTPWIGFFCQDTGLASTLDIDYVNISAPRDTGE